MKWNKHIQSISVRFIQLGTLRYLFGRFCIEKAIVTLHIHKFLSNEKWIIEEKALCCIDSALNCNYVMQIK